MRRGRSSRTAEFVAYNRALGDVAPAVPGFSDPVAEKLLPERWIAKVEGARAAARRSPGRSPYPFWFRGMGVFNQLRTVMLDRAVESARPFEQMVILGAGLDGRAFRLPGLRDAVVFEVDHPETQARKRARAAGLPLLAEELRYVAVDFTRDDLASRLAEAGHDGACTTLWLWEGVVVYLERGDVARTLSTAAARSAPGSTLVLTYEGKKNGRAPRSLFLALLGEPLRSAFEPAEFSALARANGWNTASDTGVEDWKRDLGAAADLTERQVGVQWHERIWVGRAGPKITKNADEKPLVSADVATGRPVDSSGGTRR